MNPEKAEQLLVQCDFDGTITEQDVSFLIYDVYGDRSHWRALLEEYRQGTITVGQFNARAFASVKADRAALLELILKSGRVEIKPGFQELVSFCRDSGIPFTIVSNGLDFYIDAILGDLGLSGVPFHAASSHFRDGGVDVEYIGPDGFVLDRGFKEAYADGFLGQGYSVIYVGNGFSDFPAASRCQHIFATSELIDCCQQNGVAYVPFTDLFEVLTGIKQISAGS